MILGLTVLGAGAGVVAAKLVKPVYEAQATIQLPVVLRDGGQSSQMRAAPILEGRGWISLIRAYAVLDEVVRQRQLYVEAATEDLPLLRSLTVTDTLVPDQYRVEVTPGGRVRLKSNAGVVLDEAAVGDSLGRAFGIAWRPDSLPVGREIAFRLRTPRDAAVQLGRDLTTIMPQDATLLGISLRGPDSRQTAATVNALATQFVEFATLLKREKLTTVAKALREQLINAQVELTRAETALESYRVQTITLPTDRGQPAVTAGLQETRDPVRTAYFALRTEREDLVRDRDAIARALNDHGDSARATVVALSTIPAVLGSAEMRTTIESLTQLRGELSQTRLVLAPGRPEVQQLERQVDEMERRTIPGQARLLLDNLNARVRDADARIAASGEDMRQIPLRVTEENRRERDVAVKQMIHGELQTAYQNASLAELSAQPDVRILDRAVPPTRPVSDQVLMILAAGVLGGLGLGIALALLLDFLDPRIRYPDQVTKKLGLTILGAVPRLRTDKSGRAVPDDQAALLEAVRSIRMAMLYAHGVAGTFVTTITSPGPGDGKSFVSLQLAKSFAQSGRRTLLIDGDNRRGMLHHTLGTPRKPGLTDVLTGDATLQQATRHDQASGIDVIYCGTRRANAPELLASSQMVQLMVQLRGQYEAIILDSPPLGAGVDALVLGSLAGTLALVVRTGQTDGSMAEARLGDLARLPVRVLGAILNDVKPEGAYKYYSYLPGYRSEDEGPSAPRPLIGSR